MTETKRTLLERILCRLEPLITISHRVDLGLALLREINHKLDRLLSHPPVRFELVFGQPQTRTNLPQGTTPMATTLKDTEHVSVTLTEKDAAGNPVPFDLPTPPVWTSSDDTIVTVSLNADGSIADVATTGKLGDAQITVSATLADGRTITGIGNVTVVAGDATTFELTFGTPAAK